MKEFFESGCFFILLIICIFVLCYNEDYNKQIGYTKQELKEMKESCEKDLTRSENCIIVVSYKPEQE